MNDRSRIENGCIKEAKQPWNLGHPPQKTDRAVRVHVIFTVLMFALATAYRLQAEQDDLGKKPVGWQRWRRQLLEKTRDYVIVFTQAHDGLFMWPSPRCCWGGGSRMCLQASARARTFSQNIGSQRMADRISEFRDKGIWSTDQAFRLYPNLSPV